MNDKFVTQNPSHLGRKHETRTSFTKNLTTSKEPKLENVIIIFGNNIMDHRTSMIQHKQP